MNTCKQCGEPAPEGEDLCWCCKHTKLHPSDPKPEPEETVQKQPEVDLPDHYEAIRHEFYQVWDSIEELRQKQSWVKRLIKFAKERAKRWKTES